MSLQSSKVGLSQDQFFFKLCSHFVNILQIFANWFSEFANPFLYFLRFVQFFSKYYQIIADTVSSRLTAPHLAFFRYYVVEV